MKVYQLAFASCFGHSLMLKTKPVVVVLFGGSGDVYIINVYSAFLLLLTRLSSEGLT